MALFDFDNIVRKHLPNGKGQTITYGELRKATKIKRGLTDILLELKKCGLISFEMNVKHEASDGMVITSREVLKPEEFCTTQGPASMTGPDLIKLFEFDPAKTFITADKDGYLMIHQPKKFGGTLMVAPEFWARTSELQPA